MADPMLVAVAAAVAGKITEAAAAGAKTALGNLIKLVRTRLARDDAAQAALAEAEQVPNDASRVTSLAAELGRLVKEDTKFAAQLRSTWSEARVYLQAQQDGTINQVSGAVSGHVVQARDIDGGVSFGSAR